MKDTVNRLLRTLRAAARLAKEGVTIADYDSAFFSEDRSMTAEVFKSAIDLVDAYEIHLKKQVDVEYVLLLGSVEESI